MPIPPKYSLAALLPVVAVVLVVTFWRMGDQGVPPPALPEEVAVDEGEAVLPLRSPTGLSAERVVLGERLFNDVRLSRDNSVSCATCHRLDRGGADASRFATGIGGALGAINTPTVFNASLGFVQFWDGRAATLEEQAAGPVHNPIEMDSNWDQVLAKLRADEEYRVRFARAYPGGLSADAIVDAIATFERTLVTTDSRFDRYLRGERGALSADEIEGYRRFRDYGCTSCHQGVLLGGNMYQKFGVLGDYFAGREVGGPDLGRYNVTHREEDRHVFKVPTLRNIALTAPYFHDGSAQTLEQAVAVMGRYQLGRELGEQDVRLIVAFLRTLTGKWRGEELK